MNIISQFLGQYYNYFYVSVSEILTLTVYLVILSREKQHRTFYFLRLAAALVVQITSSVLMSIIRTHHDSLGVRIWFDCTTLLILLATVVFCYREKFSEALLSFLSTVVTKNFAGVAIPLLRNLSGNDDLLSITFFPDFVPLRDWPIYYGLQIIFLLIICYFFKRGEQNREESLDKAGAVILSLFVFALRGVMHPIARYYQPLSFELSVCTKILFLIIYVLLIAIRAGLLSQKKILSELRTTEQLLLQEQKRYDEMRDSIEVINMRCHDIKRQLSTVQGKLTEGEIHALEDAIKIYDSNIRTGNEILDTLLFQKQLYCEKNNIRLSWLADGSALSFIAPSRLYALLANALENAIEAVMRLDDTKRIISLAVSRQQGYVAIEVTNFYDCTEIVQESDTSKADKVHHGFGIKSMRYIVEEYGGTLNISAEDHLFYLTIVLPLQKAG